jgi:hypothetical protein
MTINSLIFQQKIIHGTEYTVSFTPLQSVTILSLLDSLVRSGPPHFEVAIPHSGEPGYLSRYRLDGPVGGEMFRTCPDWSCDQPILLDNGYLVFSGGKAAGQWR